MRSNGLSFEAAPAWKIPDRAESRNRREALRGSQRGDGGLSVRSRNRVIPLSAGAVMKVCSGSEEDIRRESEFLFRCYSDPLLGAGTSRRKAIGGAALRFRPSLPIKLKSR
jgi:hypothetical protein